MNTLISRLYRTFHTAEMAAFPQLVEQNIAIPTDITSSTQDKFGHYQYNTAMKLAKLTALPPRKIAEMIVSALNFSDGIIEKVEIAGPGFINIFLSPSFLSQEMDVLLNVITSPTTSSKKERIIIDFSSPNVAKEMHVGHLRSTIIGDCLARLFEYLGYDVIRHNHIGDWGTAFGMLIAYLFEVAPKVLEGKDTTDLTHLVSWYKASKKRFDEDPDFKRKAQQQVVLLQKGDPTTRKGWEVICDISRKAYQEIYDLLDVRIIERGESFYNPFLAHVINDLEAKDLIEISDGAKCVYLEGFHNREGEMLPLMVQKSDGGYNYDTTDMAAIKHRIQEEKADRIIYVTDAGQSTHFQMIFKAAEKVGYLDPNKVRVDHVPFGLVLGPDGKKFKTRSGDTERLIDLLQTAVQKAHEVLKERNPDMEEEERLKLAQAIGIGSVKYADLSNNRINDYTFSYDRMLRFEGNTAAFLLYAYVRIMGIKRKTHADSALLKKHHIQLEEPSEVDLGLHLLRFYETLYSVANDLFPNRLTEYLYTLAEKFNVFFRDCRVEGHPKQNERLLLCEATGQILSQGLSILGLKTVDRM